MASHVSHGMQRKMHVGHKACHVSSHVSTCMPMEKSIKGEANQFVEEERNKKDMKEKQIEEKNRERRKGERKR